MPSPSPRVAVVDYGRGNLFSVKQACEYVGLAAEITDDRGAVLAADAVILPGVAAFGDGMAALRDRGLVEPLRDFAASGKVFVGICLGMQLLLSESEEFGRHEGLNLIEGAVVRFRNPGDPSGRRSFLEVPQVGWNTIRPPGRANEVPVDDAWAGTPLDSIPPGEYQYFVHSYYARPVDPDVVLSVTSYGNIEFCSSIRSGNIFACQYHPERSGPAGIAIYRNIARLIDEAARGEK